MTSRSFRAVWRVHMDKLEHVSSIYNRSLLLQPNYRHSLPGEIMLSNLRENAPTWNLKWTCLKPVWFLLILLSWISAFFSGSFRITCFVQPPWNDGYALCYIIRCDEQEKEDHSKHRETRPSPCHLQLEFHARRASWRWVPLTNMPFLHNRSTFK
jgi:hypothetical protein